MSKPQPITKLINLADDNSELSHLVNEVKGTEVRLLVEKSGIPVAALISARDLERLIQFEREWEERFVVVDRMREAFKDIPPEQIERDVVAIVREMREEREAERQAAKRDLAERRPA